jgi:hypothetical protein
MPCSTTVAAQLEVPSDVYYVVQTVGTIIGERHHCLFSSLYESRDHAHAELARVAAANAGSEYSVWKGSTYIQPARWARDVVLTDGTVVHPT